MSREQLNNTKSSGIVNEYTGTEYLSATGALKVCLTNDYLFRIVFQKNKYALKGLLCSVLQLDENDIVDLVVKNPITPGELINDKEFIMDILISMNSDVTIDMEMQVKNYDNWPERSLAYLCREFSKLAKGSNYEFTDAAYQISFLDYDLFPDHKEFRALYQVRNTLDNHLYTGKINLVVVSLNQTDLAKKEEVDSGLVRWAELFKAKTWEELRMIATDNKYMQSAAETVRLSEDDWGVVRAAEDREIFLRSQARKDARLIELEMALKEKDAEIARLHALLEASNIQA